MRSVAVLQGYVPNKRRWWGAGSSAVAQDLHLTMLFVALVFHTGTSARCLPLDPPLRLKSLIGCLPSGKHAGPYYSESLLGTRRVRGGYVQLRLRA